MATCPSLDIPSELYHHTQIVLRNTHSEDYSDKIISKYDNHTHTPHSGINCQKFWRVYPSQVPKQCSSHTAIAHRIGSPVKCSIKSHSDFSILNDATLFTNHSSSNNSLLAAWLPPSCLVDDG